MLPNIVAGGGRTRDKGQPLFESGDGIGRADDRKIIPPNYTLSCSEAVACDSYHDQELNHELPREH